LTDCWSVCRQTFYSNRYSFSFSLMTLTKLGTHDLCDNSPTQTRNSSLDGIWERYRLKHAIVVKLYHLGNAIPDRFANPGISGLSLLNPGIPGLIPGLNRARLWLAITGLVIGKIATTRTTRYRLNCAMHIVIGRLSCTFLHWRIVLLSVYCKSTVLFYA